MSEGFEKLQKRVLSDAKVKAEDIVREAEENAGRIVEQSRIQAQREADEIASKARLEAEALKRRILSSRIRANRLRILEEKNRMVQQVLQSVEDMLANIADDDRFQDTLKRFVSEAVEAVGVDQPIVKIGFREVSKKQADEVSKSVLKGTKVVFEEEPLDGLGGVIASDSEGKVVYNNSFRARLDRLDHQLLMLISSTIFAE